MRAVLPDPYPDSPMPVIAQLSDFHLGDDPEADARLDAVIAHVAAMATPPDAVIVTGDVLDRPAEVGDYAAVGRRLGALGLPLIACPGNHDDRAAFRRLTGQEPVDGALNGRLEVGELTILTLDTSVPGEAWGALPGSTLDWLEGALQDATGPVLVAMHHTPAPIGMPLIDAIGLREPMRLERVLQNARSVVGVVCGHAHTTATTVFAGLPLAVCPAVSMTIMLEWEVGADPVFDRSAPPGFALHLIDDGRLTTHVRVVGATLPGAAA